MALRGLPLMREYDCSSCRRRRDFLVLVALGKASGGKGEGFWIRLNIVLNVPKADYVGFADLPFFSTRTLTNAYSIKIDGASHRYGLDGDGSHLGAATSATVAEAKNNQHQ